MIVFPFVVRIEQWREEDILEGLGIKVKIWSNGSSSKCWSICSVEGERVWIKVGSKNEGGVWSTGWIGRICTTFGFGGETRGVGWRVKPWIGGKIRLLHL